MLRQLKHAASDFMWCRSLRRYESNMEWRSAHRYHDYLRRSQRTFNEAGGDLPVLEDGVRRAVDAFGHDGMTRFLTDETGRLCRSIASTMARREAEGDQVWGTEASEVRHNNYAGDLWLDFPEVRALLKGPLTQFLITHFHAWPKFLYGTAFRSERLRDYPIGSELWHTDAGPGPCVNVLVLLSDVDRDDGPLEVVPWLDAVPTFMRQPAIIRRRLADAGSPTDRIEQREVLCRYYEESIKAEMSDRVESMTGSIGTIVPFRNNCLHRGGFPRAGRERRVMIFHCYPSHLPTNWDRYDQMGLGKVENYPRDPAADF